MRLLLSSLYQSSSANTEDELKKSLKLGPKLETSKLQNENVVHLTKNSNVKIANKMYITKSGVLTETFETVLSNIKSYIEQVDFSQGQALASHINAWVEERTNGLIKNLVSSDTITSETELFLINTIYFKARWLHQFSRDSVYKSSFKSYNGQIQQADMMNIFSSFNYTKSEKLNSEIVELPYTIESNYKFWAILPEDGTSIKNVADKLNFISLKDIYNEFAEIEMFLDIPKYEIELETDAISVLKNLGVKSIFTHDASLNLLEGNSALKVDKIKQKAKITVDTDGTEAAAGSCEFFVKFVIIL